MNNINAFYLKIKIKISNLLWLILLFSHVLDSELYFGEET